MKNANGIGKRDFKKMCARNRATIEASNKSSIDGSSKSNNSSGSVTICDGEHKTNNSNIISDSDSNNNNNNSNNNNNTNKKKANSQYTHLTVVDVISEQGMQPLVILAADIHEIFHLVLVYEISANIFKVGDLISCIPREKITEVT